MTALQMDVARFCIQCGRELLPEAAFCPDCGTAVPVLAGTNPVPRAGEIHPSGQTHPVPAVGQARAQTSQAGGGKVFALGLVASLLQLMLPLFTLMNLALVVWLWWRGARGKAIGLLAVTLVVPAFAAAAAVLLL